MAQRRMFTKEITNSSDFLMMSQSAQNLYFHFGMNADDDGFCEVFTVMRMTDSKPDDLKSLHERELIFVIDGKVCIVKDWHENNQLRTDRYKQSKYMEDPKYRDVYIAIMEDKIKEISQYKALLSSGKPNGNQMEPQYSIGKDRLLPELLGKSSVPVSRKPNTTKFRAYNERNPGDEIPSVDSDGGDPEPEASGIKPNILKSYNSMLNWAEARRGFGFTFRPKQYRAFKQAMSAGKTPTDLKARWEELEQDDFYSVKGFDWTDVVSSFSKRA